MLDQPLGHFALTSRGQFGCDLFESVIIRHLLTNAADCVFDGGAYQCRRLAFRGEADKAFE